MNNDRLPLVYLIGRDEADPVARFLGDAAGQLDVSLQVWPLARDAVAEIEQALQRGRRVPEAVLLAGTEAVVTAQQIRTAAPSTHLTFIADAAERQRLQAEVRAANLGHGWSVASLDGPALADALQDAVSSSGHRRAVRTTLDRSPARVSADRLTGQRLRSLAISDALLASIMRDTIDAIIVANDRGRIMSANPAAARLFGYGQGIHRLTVPDLIPGCDTLDRAASSRVWAQVARCADGTEIPVDVTVSRVHVGESPAGYALVIRDARERIAAQTELQRQAELTASVVNGITEGVYVIDAFGNLLFSNTAAEELLGWTRDELTNRNVHDAIHPHDDAAASECPLLHAIRRGVPVRTEEQFRRSDGTWMPVECAVRPVQLQGAVIGGIFNFHDLSAFHAAQAQLRAEKQTLTELNRAKDDFIAAVSHELRTPLTAILGWLQLVTAGGANREELTEALDAIEKSARAQAHIINDLLDVSRIISGKLHMAAVRVDVADLLTTVVTTLHPSARNKGIDLRGGATAGLAVCGDAVRLNQIITNLVSNAIKFTPEGGSIEVRAMAAGDTVRIVVSDTGIGIAPELLPSIFDPYRQAEGSTAKGGLGLGLAIVRTLVELHGGSVAVESEPARGTTFTVDLPRFVTDEHCRSLPNGAGA